MTKGEVGRMVVYERIELLNSFDSPDEIAEHLREDGARGDVGSPTLCVVSRYIIGDAEDIKVSTSTVGIRVFQMKGPQLTFEYFATSIALRQFIELFDAGLYSDLED